MNPITGTPLGVEWLLAVAQVLGAIAWPVAAVVVLLAFRKPLRDALQHLIEASWGSAKLRFARAVPGVTESVVEALEDSTGRAVGKDQELPSESVDDFAELLKTNAIGAMYESFARIEQWYRDTLKAHGLLDSDRMNVRSMARTASSAGLVPLSTVGAVDGLAHLRNLAVYNPSRIRTAEAREFLVLADATLYSLRQGLATYEAEHTMPRRNDESPPAAS